MVGIARKDGENGARAVLDYLQTAPALVNPKSILDDFTARLEKLNTPVITKNDLDRLYEAARSEAGKLGLPAYKYATNDEMLAVMGLKNPVSR